MKKPAYWTKDYLLLWQGNLFSKLGDVLYSIAIGIWVYDRTGSTALMGVMSSISLLISAFLSPLCGVFVDRRDRRKIIVLADFIRGIAMIALGILALNQHMEVWMILAVAVIAGFCNVFFSPAVSTVVSVLVKPEYLLQAQSFLEGSNSLLSMIAKAISGALVALFGVPWMILINGISFLISSVSEMFIHVPKSAAEKKTVSFGMVVNDMKEAVLYVRKHSGLLQMMIGALVLNLFGSGLSSILYPFLVEKGFSIEEYGYFLSLESAAALAAVSLLAAIPVRRKKSVIMRVCVALTWSLSLAMILSKGVPWTIGMNTLCTFFNMIFNSLLNAALILSIEESMRGKVLGMVISFSTLGQAASSLMYGWIAESIGSVHTALVLTLISVVPNILFICSHTISAVMNEETVK